MAQALDVLHCIVGEDEGRGLFLKYKALTTILSVLRTGSLGLLASSLEVLLQMSAESREFHNTHYLDEGDDLQSWRQIVTGRQSH